MMVGLDEICFCSHNMSEHDMIDDIVICLGEEGDCPCWQWDPLEVLSEESY